MVNEALVSIGFIFVCS